MLAHPLVLATLLPWLPGHGPAVASPPPRVAVLSIALNNLANQPADPELPWRLGLLGAAIRDRLGTECGYDLGVVHPDAAERGGVWMADQVSQAIEHAASGATVKAHRCSP